MKHWYNKIECIVTGHEWPMIYPYDTTDEIVCEKCNMTMLEDMAQYGSLKTSIPILIMGILYCITVLPIVSVWNRVRRNNE